MDLYWYQHRAPGRNFGADPHKSNGNTIHLRGASFFDIRDGLIQHETIYIDVATLMVELGVEM